MICTAHQMLFRWSNKGGWGWWGMHRGEGKCIQGFGGETWRKEQLGRPRPSWESTIKQAVKN